MKPITTMKLEVTDFECAMCGEKTRQTESIMELLAFEASSELCETCYIDFYLDCQNDIAAQA